jgi:hypothetical protein
MVLFAALLAWAPATGLAAACEVVEARHHRRMRIEAQRILGGTVWSRHARRQPLPGVARSIRRVELCRW